MESTAFSAPRPLYDVVVIGGGPGGSTAAAILAEGGRSVLVLEAAKFPRFAVGEIVAPTGLWRVWHRLGVTQETLDSLFIRKWAGGWQAPDGSLFTFDQDVHPDDHRCRAFVYTFERAIYDDFLLKHARAKGAECREEALVEAVLYDTGNGTDGRVTGVRFRDVSGTHEVQSKVVIDASGRQNTLGRMLGLRMDIVELKSFSVFAHYENVKRNEGQQEGDVRIVFGENMWFWWAPLKAPKASIGVVAHREKFFAEYLDLGPEAFYEKYIRTCPFIWDRIKDAHRISHFRPIVKGTGQSALVDYHYICSQLFGDGWALVGDAFGFVDPIFSAGLYVSQMSAMWLAEELVEAWDASDVQGAFTRYKNRYDSEIATVMRHIQRYATDYFDPKFVNFYLGLGSRIPRIRRLYIDTFVAYDKKAVAEYTQLVDSYFKTRTPPSLPEVIDDRPLAQRADVGSREM